MSKAAYKIDFMLLDGQGFSGTVYHDVESGDFTETMSKRWLQVYVQPTDERGRPQGLPKALHFNSELIVSYCVNSISGEAANAS